VIDLQLDADEEMIRDTALAAGAEEVLLYTDLANPASNAIYQRIGYREIEDRVVLSFSQRLAQAGDLALPGWVC